MKIGIMGGSFNPIHMGHLMMSNYIREEIGLSKVLFIPTGKAPHKNNYEVDEFERYKMVDLAVRDNPYFEACDIEIKNTKTSYSVETLRKLHIMYTGCRFYFFLGSDILLDLKSWKKFDELSKLCTFICAIRPGFEKISRADMNREIKYLQNTFSTKIQLVETPRYEISSTDLRTRIENRKSVRYLIPDPVIDYIEKKSFYRGSYENR